MRVLADFEGTWALVREIVHDDGTRARATGRVAFTRESDDLSYCESGQMIIGQAAPLTFERRYVWGADLGVYFDDGRFFHHVPPMGGRAHHFCDPDTYDVTYDFSDWPRWTAHWQVSGPRKGYEMVTRFSPVSA